ncbi:MAG: enoyl-CoA hydratase-related protein, partial [Pararhizobium sp.]
MADVVALKRQEQDGLVVAERTGAMLRLTLNNPPANALSVAMMETLRGALTSAAMNRDVRVVVIAASGKVFSAGHDLKELTARRADPDRGRTFFEATMRLCADLMQTIVGLPKPVIAEVDGL